jgi:hypothetical protein
MPDLYRCKVNFGSYRATVAGDSRRSAERIVENDRNEQLERAREGDQQAQRDLGHDLQPMVTCEEVEGGDYTRGENVEDGFVFGGVQR